MKLTRDIALLDGMPVAHIRSLGLLVVADLHLGYEGAMANSGAFLPKVNLSRIMKTLESALRQTRAKRVMVVGDIKNTFSDVITDEFNELYDLVEFAKRCGVELALVKSKHDNFIERYAGRWELKVYRDQADIGGYLFFHGDSKPKVGTGTRALIMGHEHPVIGITGSSGKRERLRCFLYGTLGRRPLLVMPAAGYFSSGTEVNSVLRSRLLSPVLRNADVDRMHAIAVGYGSTIDFGAVGALRGV